MSHFYHFDTICLHGGQTVDPEFGARASPIYQTTSYIFPNTDTAASTFNLERSSHVNSRITNPTADALVAADITEDMIRLSVGLEGVADIKADFQNGFRATRKFADT
jgi:O-acetylhomoserine/O-acetylserine sulfhydrylase-like pyridoxal-dependent enzyme